MKSLYEKYRLYLVCFLAALLALLLIPHGLYNNPDFGLDPSWGIGLHYAVKNNLIFGKDFVFTYGPFGVLHTRLSIGVPAIVYLLFDAFVLLNFGFAFFRIMKRSNAFFSFVIILLCIWILNHDESMLLLWLVVFYVFEYLAEPKWPILVNLVVIAVICFFLKLSTGFIPPFMAGLAIVCGLRAKVVSPKAIAVAIILYSSLLLAVCYLLNVDLVPYIRESLHIINGYNDGMYLPRALAEESYGLELALVCVAVFVVTGLYFLRRIFKNEVLILLFACSYLFLFVLFKVSFTRFHLESFFSFVTPLYAVVLLNADKEMKRVMYGGLAICLAGSIFMLGSLGRADVLFPINTVRFIASEIGFYYKIGADYAGDSAHYSTYPPDFQLPDRMVDSIRGSSVDVVPWDIAVVTSKGLNYHGRPIVQSYSAYDGRLDQLNAEYYAAPSAPRYVLFKSESIDNRYGMFEETMTKLELLKNYATVDPGWNHILLKRLEKPLTSVVVKRDSGTVEFEQRIEVADGNNLQIGFFDFEYSALGKIRRIFYQPPDLSVTLYLDDGTKDSSKCVQTIARAGLIINRYVPNNNPAELALFVNSNGSMSKNVKAVQFHSSFPAGFKSMISYRIDHHKIEGEAKDLHGYDPIEITNSRVSGDTVASSIDKLVVNPRRIEVSGWAFNKSRPSSTVSTYLAIGPPDSLLAFKPGIKSYRPDVANYFKMKNDSSGFRMIIPGNFVKNGFAELTVLLVDKKGVISSRRLDNRIEFPSSREKNSEIGLEDLPPNSSWIADKVKFNFETFEDDEDYLTVGGWAFPEGVVLTPKKRFTVYFCFENQQERRIFRTTTVRRPDVSSHFNNSGLDQSGLKFMVSKSKLSAGSWNLVVLVEFEGKVYTGSYNKRIDVNN